MYRPSISVILCTFNPRPDILRRVVEALGAQTVTRERIDLVVIDNKSVPALTKDLIESAYGGSLRLVRESKQGLTFARIAGLAHAKADLICFVDDDNILDPDYLHAALEIANAETDLGAFGGRARPQLERRIGDGFAKFLPYFGINDHGGKPLTGPGDLLGPWTPIGAGLCIRRSIGDAFSAFVEDMRNVEYLGRTGDALLSGEDTLFSVLSAQAGLSVGYRPSLALDHVIAESRLTLSYLARLMEGHGRSRIILSAVMNVDNENDPPVDRNVDILMNALRRMRGHGFLCAYGMYFWDSGRRRQQRLASAQAGLAVRNTASGKLGEH